MTTYLRRSIAQPIRGELTWDELWKGADRGLIWNWERGRQMRAENPELAARAVSGELVQLSWKGGTQNLKDPSDGKGYGSLPYLAQWQGLRGEDLNIALDGEVTIVCSARKRSVRFRKCLDPSSDSASESDTSEDNGV